MHPQFRDGMRTGWDWGGWYMLSPSSWEDDREPRMTSNHWNLLRLDQSRLLRRYPSTNHSSCSKSLNQPQLCKRIPPTSYSSCCTCRQSWRTFLCKKISPCTVRNDLDSDMDKKSVADPYTGSGAFLTPGPGSGIRNRFFSGSRISDYGSRIPNHIFEMLVTNFWVESSTLKLAKIFFFSISKIK